MQRHTWHAIHLAFGLWVLAMLTVSSPGAHAQQPSSQLNETARGIVVRTAAAALRQQYVFPDVGRKAAEKIESELAEHHYDQFEKPADFARRLTEDLQSVAHDKHLRVTGFGSPPPAGPDGKPFVPPRSEWGVVRADLLPGNVGYIEINAFPSLEVFQRPVDRAMAALAKTRALIVDVRRHGGGTHDAETYFASYFLKGNKRVAVNKFVTRIPGTETYRTSEFFSSPTPFSYAGKPVYVLTSSVTFSGGEAIAYDMRALKLAKVIGETTAGGANPGGPVFLGLGFVMNVPSGRGENPTTGTNWEGVGVVPDVPTPASDALRVALEKLGVSSTQTQIDALSQARLFEPRTTPLPGSEAAIRRLADEIARGEPRYDLMTASWARRVRQTLTTLRERFSEAGPIESLKFKEVDAQGADRFEVKHANFTLIWGIGFDKDDKIATVGWIGPVPPS